MARNAFAHALGQTRPRSLSPSAADRLSERDNGLPVWVRAPVSGYEHFSGLSRTYLYKLATDRKIVSKSICEPGKLRGCRLFHLKSILDYIDSCPDGGLCDDTEDSVTDNQ